MFITNNNFACSFHGCLTFLLFPYRKSTRNWNCCPLSDSHFSVFSFFSPIPSWINCNCYWYHLSCTFRLLAHVVSVCSALIFDDFSCWVKRLAERQEDMLLPFSPDNTALAPHWWHAMGYIIYIHKGRWRNLRHAYLDFLLGELGGGNKKTAIPGWRKGRKFWLKKYDRKHST